MAYDLGIVGDIAARLNRAGEPGVGPGAGAGDRFGLGRRVAPVVLGLDLVVHVGPKRIARVEHTRLPLGRIGVVLILGILNEDLCLTGKRCGGRGGDGIYVALVRGNRSHRGGRFGAHSFSTRRIARRCLIGKGARNGRSVARSTGIARSIGALLTGRVVRSNLGIACVCIARNSIGRSRKRWLASSSALGVFIREGRARSKRRRHRHRDKHGDHALPKSVCILMGVNLGNAARRRAIRRIATGCERFFTRKEWTESHRYLTSRAQCDG